MVNSEGQTEEKPPVDLAAPADPVHKARMDRPAQEPDDEARPLHAQQDQALHWKLWPDDQVLVHCDM